MFDVPRFNAGSGSSSSSSSPTSSLPPPSSSPVDAFTRQLFTRLVTWGDEPFALHIRLEALQVWAWGNVDTYTRCGNHTVDGFVAARGFGIEVVLRSLEGAHQMRDHAGEGLCPDEH